VHDGGTVKKRHQKVFNRGLYVGAGGLDVCAGRLKSKNSFYLQCFIFQIGDFGALFVGSKPTKAPRGDWHCPLTCEREGKGGTGALR